MRNRALYFLFFIANARELLWLYVSRKNVIFAYKSICHDNMRKLLCFAFVLATMVSCGGNAESSSFDSNFRMHLRLWPAHHTDTELRDDLVGALKEYKGVFDEVWLCTEFETLSMPTHRASAKMMGDASRVLSELGIDVSFQGISIGHGDNFESGADELRPTDWTTIIDAFGNRTQMSHCPRQKAFLDYISEYYATYAKECNPRVVWIDDDLRVTSHHPARMLCFCDTCIAEFNKQYGYNWTTETLKTALDNNYGNGELRQQWIAFSQESLALVAEAVAKGVHSVSPSSRVGIQQVNFHRELLEGRDWNKSYAAIERVTGLEAASRPGNGFYDDDSPHGMIGKAYDMARQVRRLTPSVKEIAAEVEGYRHYATGKSPQGLCTESMLYLAMGVTQLSYAIICSASEPMEWYADNYFRFLQRWRPMCEEYAAFNIGTEPGGVDAYISRRVVERNAPGWGWIATNAGDVATGISTLGVPLCPDGNYPVALLIDAPSAYGMPVEELKKLLNEGRVVLDFAAWNYACHIGLNVELKAVDVADVELAGAAFYEGSAGGKVAVIPAYTTNISNAERLAMTRAIDWASGGRLPVVMESMAQAVVVPRVDSEGALRSVAVLNTTISEQPATTLRLRGCSDAKRFVWHSVGERDRKLSYKHDGDDVIITIPSQHGWFMGWLSVE